MNDLYDRWRDGLEVEALTIDIAPDGAGPERVMRLGRRRRRRHQAVATVACMSLVAGSAAAWNANRAGRGGERPIELRVADETDGGVESPATTIVGGYGLAVDPATLPPVALVPSPLAWSAVEVPFGQGVNVFLGAAENATSGLLAVSTSPGVRKQGADDRFALYRSDDGAVWSTAGDLGDDHWFGNIARTADGLVAVGTAAATGPIERNDAGNGVGDVVVSYADGDGKDWTDVVLPIDLRGARRAADASGFELNAGVLAARVVAAGGITTVAVSIVGQPASGYGPLLAAVGATDDGGVTVLRTGLRVGDRTYPWSELGVEPAVAAVLGSRTVLYRSADGTTFGEIGAVDDAMVQDLVALGDEVALVLNNTANAGPGNPMGVHTALVAPDGTVTDLPDLPLDPGLFSSGSLGGQLRVAGQQGGWPALATWTGSAWRVQSLANGVVRDGTTMGFEQAAIGEGGVAFALSEYDDPTAGLSVSDRGWSLRSLGGNRGIAVVEEGSGRQLALFPTINDLDSVPGKLRAVRGTLPEGSAGATTTNVVAPMGVHKVQPGDTAMAIAERFGVTVVDLRAANPDVDLDLIVPGQALLLPGASSGATTTTMSGPATGIVALEVLDDAGAVVATLDVASLARRIEGAWNPSSPPGHTVRLLHSLDGVTWSIIDLGEQAGAPVTMVTSLVSTPDGIVATVATDQDDPDAPDPAPDQGGPFKRRVALVGARS